MRTKIIEAVQSREGPGNWGRFLVGEFTSDDLMSSHVKGSYGTPILATAGWGPMGQGYLLVLDLVTGEGAILGPGGLPEADLEKHAIWVCPMFGPFLAWLYRQPKPITLNHLPSLVELPEAEFAFHGYRREGPAAYRQALVDLLADPGDARAVARAEALVGTGGGGPCAACGAEHEGRSCLEGVG